MVRAMAPVAWGLLIPAAASAQTVPTAPSRTLNATSVTAFPAPPLRTDQPQTVTERQQARDRPLEVLLAGVRLLPTVSFEAKADSNVFAAPRGAADLIANPTARLAAETTWSRHQLRAQIDGGRSLHMRFKSENATELRGVVAARVDFKSSFKLSPSATWERLAEPRTSSGAPVLAAAPVTYTHRAAALDVDWQGARTTLQVGGNADRYNYGEAVVGRQSIDGSLRDYTRYSAHVRLNYDLDSAREVFVSAERRKIDYRVSTLGGLDDRDSRGWAFTAGLASEITPLIRGRIGIGYLTERYSARSARPVSALAVDMSLDWFASELVTVHLEGSRRLEAGASADAFGYLSTRLAARVDHELLRSLVLNLAGSVELADFRSVDRRDRTYLIEAGARYQLNRSLFVRGRVALLHRSSTGSDSAFPYTKRWVSIEATYQY